MSRRDYSQDVFPGLYDGTEHPVRIFDGPPPINQDTCKKFRAVMLAMPRGTGTEVSTGAIVRVTVGGESGEMDRREFILSPGRPAVLWLGNYHNAKIQLLASHKPLTFGSQDPKMNFPVRIVWLDNPPFDWAASPLFSPIINAANGSVYNVPDGGIEVISEVATDFTWREYTQEVGTTAYTQWSSAITPNIPVRTQGEAFEVVGPSASIRFILAPL